MRRSFNKIRFVRTFVIINTLGNFNYAPVFLKYVVFFAIITKNISKANSIAIIWLTLGIIYHCASLDKYYFF